jgi:hypothetical protein
MNQPLDQDYRHDRGGRDGSQAVAALDDPEAFTDDDVRVPGGLQPRAPVK